MSSYQKFIDACNRTNMWKSDQEESERYSRYPRWDGFNLFRWHILNFRSKWEFRNPEDFKFMKKDR